MAEITILGVPQGKERPRVVRSGNKSISYTSSKTKDYEKQVALCYQIARQEYFGTKPLKATITAYYPVPQSNSKKIRETKLQQQILPCIKPDCDNIAKIILDALNGIAYEDDKQVVFLVVGKLYSDNPRVVVKLEEMIHG